MPDTCILSIRMSEQGLLGGCCRRKLQSIGELGILLMVSMAVFRVGLFLLILRACRSALAYVDLVNPLTEHERAPACVPQLGTHYKNCMSTCVEGQPTHLCFCGWVQLVEFTSVDHSPILPELVCNHVNCLPPTDCRPRTSELPFGCLDYPRSHCHRSQWRSFLSKLSKMAGCYFNQAQGNSTSYMHGQEVEFDVQRQNSEELSSNTCLCYNGTWISSHAIQKAKEGATPNPVLCSVNDSTRGRLRYLRVRNITNPRFPRDSKFVKKSKKLVQAKIAPYNKLPPKLTSCVPQPGRHNIKCLATCVDRQETHICFCGASISADARHSQILPGWICNVVECLPSRNCSGRDRFTQFPSQCLPGLMSDPRADRCWLDNYMGPEGRDGNVMYTAANCYFNQAQGNSTIYTHGQKVRFEVKRRNSEELSSHTCLCYNGKWISHGAIQKAKRGKKPKHVLCFVNDSTKGSVRYLRVKKNISPTFPRDSAFVKKGRQLANAVLRQ